MAHRTWSALLVAGLVGLANAGSDAVGAQNGPPMPTSEMSWELRPVLLEPPPSAPTSQEGGIRATVWIGIRSIAKDATFASLVCVAAIWADIGEGTLAVSRGNGSPHACRHDEAYALLLPGGIVYVPWETEFPALWSASTEMRLNLEVDSKVPGKRQERIRRQVVWKGTVGQLLHEGERLMASRP